jgi:hypothetical protein
MTDYHHDYAAFDRLVLCAPFMVEEMLSRGAKVLARAEATAPYDEDDPDGVHYRESFVLTGGIREGKTRRAYARVSNHDMPTALLVEFGAWNVPRYRILGNALDGASGSIHGRTFRAITKGTKFEPPPPKPRKPKKGTTP